MRMFSRRVDDQSLAQTSHVLQNSEDEQKHRHKMAEHERNDA